MMVALTIGLGFGFKMPLCTIHQPPTPITIKLVANIKTKMKSFISPPGH
jgi:hypothetical protein